jgi:hypothetical protein
MTPEQLELVKQHAKAIAEILYSETDPETLDSLEVIETVVRQKIQEHVSPEVGIFLSEKGQAQLPEEAEP